MLDEATMAEHELQGRRREDGAEGRRARFPEGQGHRRVDVDQRRRRSPHVGRRRRRASRARARRSRWRRRCSRVSRRRAPSSTAPGRMAINRSTASTPRSAPTPGSRLAAGRSRRVPAARGPRTCGRRRRRPTIATSCARCCSRGIAGMAAGGSGVSPHVLDALVAMVNRGVHPVVPRLGSIGVADLPQLSHLALPLIDARRSRVRRRDACPAAKRCGAPASPRLRSDRRTDLR